MDELQEILAELQEILAEHFSVKADTDTILCVLQELGFKNLSEISQEDLPGISDRVRVKVNQSQTEDPEKVSSQVPVTASGNADEFVKQLEAINNYQAEKQAELMLREFNKVPEIASGYFVNALLAKQEAIKQNPQMINLNISLAHVLATEAITRNQMICFFAPFALTALCLLITFIPRGNNDSNIQQNKTELIRSNTRN